MTLLLNLILLIGQIAFISLTIFAILVNLFDIVDSLKEWLWKQCRWVLYIWIILSIIGVLGTIIKIFIYPMS